MPNLNYQRSRAKEYAVKKQLENEGYYCIRASGSHGVADIVAISPSPCNLGDHFIVRFIQIKCSEKIKVKKETIKVEETPCGLVNVEYWQFPIKSKKYYAHFNRPKNKKEARVQSSKRRKRVGR